MKSARESSHLVGLVEIVDLLLNLQVVTLQLQPLLMGLIDLMAHGCQICLHPELEVLQLISMLPDLIHLQAISR
jgi:hypothetical protein